MIETVIEISMGVIALLTGLSLGYSWGRRKGESSGFERGLRAQIRTNEAYLNEYRTKFERYQCSRKFFIRSSWNLEDLELAATSQVQIMNESIIKLLMDNKVIRPYILSQELSDNDIVWTVGISLYCSPDPVATDFEALPFIRRPLSGM